MIEKLLPRYRVVLGEVRWISGFAVTPDTEFFYQFLKKKSSSTESSTVKGLIRETEVAAKKLIHPSAAYGIFMIDELLAEWFPLANYVALGIVTIGDSLESKVDDCLETDQLTCGVLFDGWGSAFAEGAAESVCRAIEAEATLLGCTASKRRSPGFGKWELSAQQQLLRYLSADRLGIRLTDSFTMVPRKSISFGVPLARSYSQTAI